MRTPWSRTLHLSTTLLLLLGAACESGKLRETEEAARKKAQVKEVKEAIAHFQRAMREGRIEEAKRYVSAKKLAQWGPMFASMAKDLSKLDMNNVTLKAEGDVVKLYQEQEGMLGGGTVSVSIYLNIKFAKEGGQWKWED